MNREAYLSLSKYEERHWWFVSRRMIIGKVLSRFFSDRKLGSILEVGCGSGGNLELLSSFGKTYAMEKDDGCVEIASRRNICTIRKGSLPDDIPFTDKFDLICMLDVLEHVDDDISSLKAVSERMTGDGKVFITVPAYNFLWSGHDVALEHKGRYTRKRLFDVLAKAGMRPVYSTYFNTILMPLVLMVRTYNNLMKKKDTDDNRISSEFTNSVLRMIFSSERFLVPAISLPFGVSILVLAERRGNG